MTTPTTEPPDRRTRQVLPDALGAPVPGPGTTSEATSGASSAVPWALAQGRPIERSTARVRARVHRLPAWDPLPPGDVDVRRSGSRRPGP